MVCTTQTLRAGTIGQTTGNAPGYLGAVAPKLIFCPFCSVTKWTRRRSGGTTLVSFSLFHPHLPLYFPLLICYTFLVNQIPASWPVRGKRTAQAEQDNGVKLPNGTAAVSACTLPWRKPVTGARSGKAGGRTFVHGVSQKTYEARPFPLSPGFRSGLGLFCTHKNGCGVLLDAVFCV